jgi:hypothetical protein
MNMARGARAALLSLTSLAGAILVLWLGPRARITQSSHGRLAALVALYALEVLALMSGLAGVGRGEGIVRGLSLISSLCALALFLLELVLAASYVGPAMIG